MLIVVVTDDELLPAALKAPSFGSLTAAVLVTLGGVGGETVSVFTRTVRLFEVAPAASTVTLVQVTWLPFTVLTGAAPVQVHPVPVGTVLMRMPAGSGSSTVMVPLVGTVPTFFTLNV